MQKYKAYNGVIIMTKISIVMPVFNSEIYLREAIESLRVQTFKDFELICVNDGSTDSSLEILNEFNKKYNNFIKIISTENQGAGAARNYGFQFVQGETTIFLDSDDYFYPNFLQEMYKKYTETKADIVVCQYYISKLGKLIPEPKGINTNMLPNPCKLIFNKYDIPDYIFNFTNYAVRNKLYSTEFLKKHNIQFENVPSGNDVLFSLLSLFYAEKITTLLSPLVVYKAQNKNSISSKGTEILDMYKFETFEKLKKIVLANPENKNFEISLYNSYLTNILISLNYTKRNTRLKYLDCIKKNFKPVSKKENVYNPLNYYKLYLIEKLPKNFYILLYYKVVCNISKVFSINQTSIFNFIFNLFNLPN